MHSFLENHLSRILTFICIIYFCYIVFPLINVLGVNIDEGLPGIIALDFVSQFLEGLPYRFELNNMIYNKAGVDYLQLGDIALPVVTWAYEGAVGVWMTSFFLLLSDNLNFALRFPHLIFAVITIISVYITLKNIFDKWTALLAVFLLAVNSVFLEATLVGNFKDEIHQLAFFYMGTAFFSHFYLHKKNAYLYISLGAFSLGVGLMAKFMFFGFLVPLFFIVVFFKDIRRVFIQPKIVFCFILFFALGFSPVIIYYLKGNFYVFISFLESLFTSSNSHNNLDILGNLKLRAGDFITFAEQNMMISINYAERFKINNLYSFNLFVLGMIYFVIKKNKKILTVFLFYFILWLLTIFVPGIRSESHMVMLFPFVEIILACFILSFFRESFYAKKVKKFLAVLLIILSVLVAGKNIKNDFLLSSYIKTNNVLPMWSSLSYQAFDYLLENDIKEIYSVCQMFNPHTVAYMTKREVKVKSFWTAFWEKPEYLEKETLITWLDKSFLERKSQGNKNIFYLVLDGVNLKKENIPQNNMLEIIAERNYKIETLKTFSDKYNSVSIYRVNRNN